MKKLMILFLWLFLLVACQYNYYGNSLLSTKNR